MKFYSPLINSLLAVFSSDSTYLVQPPPQVHLDQFLTGPNLGNVSESPPIRPLPLVAYSER